MAAHRFLAPTVRPLVLGHRGASFDCPENTLLAFSRAMADGADGVELDAMRCASGEVVVVHDDDLKRVADGAPGSEKPVRQSTLSELQRFDIGQGERVPTLSDVLTRLGPTALCNIELKSPEVRSLADHALLLRDDGLAEATVELLIKCGRPPGSTLVSSFDPLQLFRFDRAARRLGLTDVPLGFLFQRDQARLLREAWLAPLLPLAALHPDGGLVDAVAMRRWRQQGYKVHVWTVDDPHEVSALAALGVDAIITNKPQAVRARLEAADPAAQPGRRLEPSH